MTRLRLLQPMGRFFGPKETFLGKGALGTLALLGAQRMAILVSPTMSRRADISTLLQRTLRRIRHTIVVVPAGEPSLDRLQPVFSAVSEFRPDWIVAIGGGATIDAAKLAWVLYENPAATMELLVRPFAVQHLRGLANFAAAPTTTGSGSEASMTATFQAEASDRKRFVISYDLIPDVAILDPILVTGAPPDVLAASAFDALSHALEGAVSRHANPMTTALAESSARTLLSGLDRLTQGAVDEETLLDLLIGANLGGLVQNIAVPGVAHAVAHQLAAVGVPHSAATGSMLGLALQFNAARDATVRKRLDRVARSLGKTNLDMLVDHIRDLAKACRIFDRFDPSAALRGVSRRYVRGQRSGRPVRPSQSHAACRRRCSKPCCAMGFPMTLKDPTPSAAASRRCGADTEGTALRPESRREGAAAAGCFERSAAFPYPELRAICEILPAARDHRRQPCPDTRGVPLSSRSGLQAIQRHSGFGSFRGGEDAVAVVGHERRAEHRVDRPHHGETPGAGAGKRVVGLPGREAAAIDRL